MLILHYISIWTNVGGGSALLKSPDGFNHAKVYIYSPGYIALVALKGNPGEEETRRNMRIPYVKSVGLSGNYSGNLWCSYDNLKGK